MRGTLDKIGYRIGYCAGWIYGWVMLKVSPAYCDRALIEYERREWERERRNL